MASIIKRPTPNGIRYRVQIRLKGHRTISKTFSVLSIAKRWAERTESLIIAGEYHEASQDHTLRELVERYFDAPIKLTARRSHAEWWVEHFGDIRLAAVSRAGIIEGRDKLLRTKTSRGRMTGATSNRYLASLSTICSYAVEIEWMASNPVFGIRRQKERGRVRYLGMDGRPKDEKQRLLAVCKTSDPMLYELVLLALLTGARASELLRLRWSDIDFNRGRAHLRRTKNGLQRQIPVRGKVAGLLRRRRGIGLVFHRPDGSTYYYRSAFERACRDAGVEDFTFHCLRHTTAAELAIAGESLHHIGLLLGHRSPTTTARYAHLCPPVVDRLGELLAASEE